MSEQIKLKDFSYGKTGVRLLKVARHGLRHDVKDLNIAIHVFGLFEAAYCDGDNSTTLPTDTLKNTVYVLARQHAVDEIESFGMRIANHLLARNTHFSRIKVAISEKIWKRIDCDGLPRECAFQTAGPEARSAVIDSGRTKNLVWGGISNLPVLKTAQSAFENFLRDEYTILKDTSDRLLASEIEAEWLYGSEEHEFGESWQQVRKLLLESFAKHASRSVQHTLYAMGEAVLQQCSFLEQIRLSMPNRHCLPVDLSRFSLDNPNEVFVPVEEPSGVIQATLERAHANWRDWTVAEMCLFVKGNE